MHERVIGEEINAEDVREGDLIDWWRGSTIHVSRVERHSQALVCLYSPQGQRYDFAYQARAKLLGEQNDDPKGVSAVGTAEPVDETPAVQHVHRVKHLSGER